MANSIRRAILQKNPEAKVTVGTLYNLNRQIAGKGDIDVVSEKRLIQLIDSGRFKVLVGDPLMEDLLEEGGSMTLKKLPHVALSSKLYWNQAPRYISEEFEKFIDSLVEL